MAAFAVQLVLNIISSNRQSRWLSDLSKYYANWKWKFFKINHWMLNLLNPLCQSDKKNLLIAQTLQWHQISSTSPILGTKILNIWSVLTIFGIKTILVLGTFIKMAAFWMDYFRVASQLLLCQFSSKIKGDWLLVGYYRPLKSHNFAVRLMAFSSISLSQDETQKSHNKQSYKL